MNKLLLIAAAVILPLCVCAGDRSACPTPEVKVMTFNIRTDTPIDSLNAWPYRKDRVANAIKFYDADIVGTQEVRPHQLTDLEERLPGYAHVGQGRRSDGNARDEHCTLWYKADRFDMLDNGTFWLSENPDKIGSKGWDSAYPRIATWAKLRDRITGKELLAVNTHLDHKGPQARREGARLLLTKVNELGQGLPVVMTGDFNARPDEVPYQEITDMSNPLHLTDSRTVAALVYGPAWTWHNFGRTPMDRRCFIDYLFVGGPLTVNRYGVLAEKEGNEFLSDHAPALIGITLD
ncbi:MAG: endonuclease/exonuclease/phosphatase family protein [Muribaculaceae bacterium]|nr:endonuclease/exonuclease/phosphatase family protein [Muribaculaceae bacterium]